MTRQDTKLAFALALWTILSSCSAGGGVINVTERTEDNASAVAADKLPDISIEGEGPTAASASIPGDIVGGDTIAVGVGDDIVNDANARLLGIGEGVMKKSAAVLVSAKATIADADIERIWLTFAHEPPVDPNTVVFYLVKTSKGSFLGLLPLGYVKPDTAKFLLTLQLRGLGTYQAAVTPSLINKPVAVNLDPQPASPNNTPPAPNLALLGTANTGGNARAAYVNGGNAYVAGGFGLRVINVANAAAPSIVSQINPSPQTGLFGPAVAVTVIGTKAYAACDVRIRRVNAADPLNINLNSVEAGAQPQGTPTDLTAAGPNWLIVGHSQGAQALNVAQFQYQTGFNTGGMPVVAATGNDKKAFIAGAFGIIMIDVATLPTANVVLVDDTAATGLTIDGTHLFAVGDTGLRIFDFTDAANVKPLGTIAVANTTSVAVKGNYAYTAGATGVNIVNIKDKLKPELLAQQPNIAITGATKIVIAGDKAYISDQNTGLSIIGGVP